jgi:hypothetical protein
LCAQLLKPLTGVPADGQRQDIGELPSRLPFVMSFGYEVGCGMHAVVEAPEAGRAAAARLCALFNLGIALFDQVSDQSPDGHERLTAAFDKRTLVRLLEDPEESLRLLGWRGGDAAVDLLFRVIGAFFQQLHHATGSAVNTARWLRLSALLQRAYEAELTCIDPRASERPAVELIAAANRKSAIPFEVMLQLVAICADEDLGADCMARGDELATHLGVIFRLVDDLADLARDGRSGAVNTIRLEARRRADGPLVQEQIRLALRRVRTHFDGVTGILVGLDTSLAETNWFREVLLAYITSWIGNDNNEIHQ